VKRTSLIPLAGVLTVALLGLPGCAKPDPTERPATSVPASTPAFGGTDLAWIEVNIAMDEQILPLLDLTPKQTGTAASQSLALQVKTFITTELSTLRALHDQAALPSANPHEGMPMPGMVTPDEVTKAATLTGAKFDTELVSQIKAHLEQGKNLADSEEKSGVESQTRALASQVIQTRTQVLSSIGD
jgi:uncharacterized protein (DUF305 family)